MISNNGTILIMIADCWIAVPSGTFLPITNANVSKCLRSLQRLFERPSSPTTVSSPLPNALLSSTDLVGVYTITRDEAPSFAKVMITAAEENGYTRASCHQVRRLHLSVSSLKYFCTPTFISSFYAYLKLVLTSTLVQNNCRLDCFRAFLSHRKYVDLCLRLHFRGFAGQRIRHTAPGTQYRSDARYSCHRQST